MDQPLINEGSFSTENPSMAEIWPINSDNSGILGLRMGSGNFGSNLTNNLLNNNNNNNNVSFEESSISGQSVSVCVGGVKWRKKREIISQDESSKVVSTTCSGIGLKKSNGKRMKTSGSEEANGSSKAGGETGSTKPSEKSAEPLKDYIHVRARRGQATDSHSLAERARREKISERMKFLQDLVPGCNKVIGKAIVLDEIINYIQSLQRQVEFLSMKLEAVNSGMIPSINGFHSKDVNQLMAPSFDPSGMMFSAQAAPARELARGGPHLEWLHMQLGGSFERMT